MDEESCETVTINCHRWKEKQYVNRFWRIENKLILFYVKNIKACKNIIVYAMSVNLSFLMINV